MSASTRQWSIKIGDVGCSRFLVWCLFREVTGPAGLRRDRARRAKQFRRSFERTLSPQSVLRTGYTRTHVGGAMGYRTLIRESMIPRQSPFHKIRAKHGLSIKRIWFDDSTVDANMILIARRSSCRLSFRPSCDQAEKNPLSLDHPEPCSFVLTGNGGLSREPHERIPNGFPSFA